MKNATLVTILSIIALIALPIWIIKGAWLGACINIIEFKDRCKKVLGEIYG